MESKLYIEKKGLKKTEKFGLIILTVIILLNLIIAFNFYFLKSIKIPEFFYQQANKNEYYDPNKRY